MIVPDGVPYVEVRISEQLRGLRQLARQQSVPSGRAISQVPHAPPMGSLVSRQWSVHLLRRDGQRPLSIEAAKIMSFGGDIFGSGIVGSVKLDTYLTQKGAITLALSLKMPDKARARSRYAVADVTPENLDQHLSSWSDLVLDAFENCAKGKIAPTERAEIYRMFTLITRHNFRNTLRH